MSGYWRDGDGEKALEARAAHSSHESQDHAQHQAERRHAEQGPIDGLLGAAKVHAPVVEPQQPRRYGHARQRRKRHVRELDAVKPVFESGPANEVELRNDDEAHETRQPDNHQEPDYRARETHARIVSIESIDKPRRPVYA